MSDQRRGGGRGRGDGGGRGNGGRRDDRSGRPNERGGASREQGAGRPPRGEPAGIERAERTKGVPPPSPRRRKDAGQRVEPPDLSRVSDPDVPRGVMGELKRHAAEPVEVARAVTIAGDLVDEGRPEEAVRYLRWAKQEAPRAPSVREALGIALYLAEDWADALTELQTYRRFTGRSDQNHLMADCVRALERPTARVGELVQEMDPERDGLDRVAEGTIVWASALADAGDPGAGRAVLRRLLPRLEDGEPAEHHLRVWYVAGDLAEREGDDAEARRWFARVAAVDDELFEVGERLSKLG